MRCQRELCEFLAFLLGGAMGYMLNGRWVDDDTIPADARGTFVRADSQFRNWVTVDGSAGLSGNAGFKAEPGRYHLFVS